MPPLTLFIFSRQEEPMYYSTSDPAGQYGQPPVLQYTADPSAQYAQPIGKVMYSKQIST